MSLSKYLAKFHGERIDALRAVREAITRLRNGERLPVKGGSSLNAVLLDDKAVKFASPSLRETPEELYKQMKRRGFLESILHDNGLAPKTHLIETRSKKYMVQPKGDFPNEFTANKKKNDQREAAAKNWLNSRGFEPSPRGVDDPITDVALEFAADVEKIGMTPDDLGGSNIQWFDGKPLAIDAGYEKLNRAMTPAERKSALQKFISYGKRSK